MDAKKKSLKNAYENTVGEEISERQWRRIKNEYLGGVGNLRVVKTFAQLRKVNGRRRITLSDINRVKGFDSFVQMLGTSGALVTGADILDAFNRLDPSPSESTIRRWGKEIGIPIRKDDYYTPVQAQAWLKLASERITFKLKD